MPHETLRSFCCTSNGGPSQLETYDLKPDAPIEYRSVFAPIPTNVPGLDLCELFPLQAKIADKFSLVRSLNHDVNIHSDGGIVILTGKRPTQLDPTSRSKSEHPDFGSVASRVRGWDARGIPPYVAIPQKPYMTQPTYLGLHHAAFEVADPSSNRFRSSGLALTTRGDLSGLDDRKNLLEKLDQLRRAADTSGQLDATDNFRALAMKMLTSSQTAAAFDLGKEDEQLRDRYGRHLWGQGCLLARRLAEAGASVISLNINTPKNGPEFTNWDDHIANAGRPGHFADYMKNRLPYLDQGALRADRGPVPARTRPTSPGCGDGRIWSHAEVEPKCDRSRTRSLAASLHGPGFRRRFANGTSRRRDERQIRIPDRTPLLSAGPVGHDLSPPGNRRQAVVRRPVGPPCPDPAARDTDSRTDITWDRLPACRAFTFFDPIITPCSRRPRWTAYPTISHSLMLRSKLPDAMRRPSGENASP